MPRTRTSTVGTALVLAFVSSFTIAQASPPVGHNVPRKQAQLPPSPEGPLSQVPMELIPPAAPHVTYQRGLMTIVAQNSTLADILLDVRKLTGASIDIPPNATERVVTQLGPGPVRDVLAGLLNGTGFNYVMAGSSSDPAALSALLLIAKPAGGPGGSVAAVTSFAMLDESIPATPPQQVPPPVPVQAANATVAEDDADADTDDAEDAQAAGDASGQPAGPPQGLTPEQIQQMRDKMGPPPNIPPLPLMVSPPNPVNPHQ
jgi:hypothetical protein